MRRLDRVFLRKYKGAIEDFVNSQEAVDIAYPPNTSPERYPKFVDFWGILARKLEDHLGVPLPSEVQEALYADLRDWWKQGNFQVWKENETNIWGFGRWELGDPDFWR